jgi:cytochrome c556
MNVFLKWNRPPMGAVVTAGLIAALAVGAAAFSLTAAEPKYKRADTQIFMRMKLAWSQMALEGLALERFDLVSKNAIRLRDMTQSNQWFTMKQPDYLTHTTNFQKSADALYLAAVDKNLDAATEAYAKLARNCVECHRIVRVEQRKNAAVPDTGKAGSNPLIAP